MNTTFEEIYEMFLLYTEAPEYAEMEELLAKDDLEKKLKDAIAMFTKAKNIIPDYEIGEFNRELEQIEKLIADNIKTKAKVTKQLGDFFSSDGWIDRADHKEGDE